MISEEVERLHRQSLVVEGHRDVFEMVRLMRSGENFPIVNKILPRLKRGSITVCVFAVCGDAVSHSNGTYRYLHAALENIDAMRREAEASGGKIKFILSADDLPAAPVEDTVYFLLSFEGGKPLEGRLEYLRTFTSARPRKRRRSAEPHRQTDQTGVHCTRNLEDPRSKLFAHAKNCA
jgi:microsomal dipeptidase-like Zn-dependent dipeptidase